MFKGPHIVVEVEKVGILFEIACKIGMIKSTTKHKLNLYCWRQYGYIISINLAKVFWRDEY